MRELFPNLIQYLIVFALVGFVVFLPLILFAKFLAIDKKEKSDYLTMVKQRHLPHEK